MIAVEAGLPQVGAVIGERFVLERLAAAGGMGAVYQARDVRTRAMVAVKFVLQTAPELVDRFERESQILADLKHPAIVRHVAHGKLDDGAPWLAMAWLEGEDLHARLAEGRLSVADTLALAQRLARALSLTHGRGVIHRDLKPSNIFLVEREIAKATLLDFGVARAHGTSLTRVGSMIGTVGYMAPEQARGEQVGPEADVFALGCVLFECLAGRLPFPGDTPIAVLAKILLEDAPPLAELRRDVPDSVARLIAQMLDKDPSRRPRDAIAVAGALSALEKQPAVAPGVRSFSDKERDLISVILIHARYEPDANAHASLRDEGLSVVWLSPVAAVGTVRGRGVATDRARRAARCALAARAALRDAHVVLATGRADTSGHAPTGEVIDRAVAMLRDDEPSGDGVLIDDVTASLLDARFDVAPRSRGSVELLKERPRGDSTRTLLGRPAPFVGRQQDLAAVLSWIARAFTQREATGVIVKAPPGIGKSRLRLEVVQAIVAEETDAGVLIERAEPSRVDTPYGIVAPMLRRACRIVEGDTADTQREKLAERVSRHVAESDRARVVGSLATMIDLAGKQDQIAASGADPRVVGDQIQRALADFFDAESAVHPVLLVVDDLHWADGASMSLLSGLLSALSRRPFVVLGFARPDIDARFPDAFVSSPRHVVELQPLGRSHVAELLTEAIGPAIPPETITRVAELSQGNPFFVEELARALVNGEHERLPQSIVAMANDRIASLTPDRRRVLRAASIFGGAFWRGGLERMLSAARTLRPTLASLVEEEFIVGRDASRFPSDEEYVFRHALLREAAYEMLTDEDRAAGHAAAAHWLEGSGERSPGVLAHHFERGGDTGRALGHHVAAAERALLAGDFASVLRHVEAAVAYGAESETLGRARLYEAQARRWRGEHRFSAAAASQAMSLLVRGSDEWFSAAAEVATESFDAQEGDNAVAVARQLYEFAVQSPTPAAVTATARTASALFQLGRIAEGEALVDALGATASSTLDLQSRPRVLQARAKRALVRGDVGDHLRMSAAAADAFAQAGDTRAACAAGVSVGYGLVEVGRYGEAERALRDAAEAASRFGLRNMWAWALHNLGIALARSGHVDEGGVVEEQAASAFRDQANTRGEAGSCIYLAEIRCAQRRWGDAEPQARRAMSLCEGNPALRALAEALLARSLRGSGDTRAALTHAAAAVTAIEAAGWTEDGEALIRLELAEALLANGDHEGATVAARAATDRLLARAERIGDTAIRESFLLAPDHARTIHLHRDIATRR